MSSDHDMPRTPRRNSTDPRISPGLNINVPPASPRRRSTGIMIPRMMSPQHPGAVRFEETERQTTQVKETHKGFSIHNLHRRHSSVATEASNWHGSHRAKLVEDGYRSLALMTTFIAAVQGQLLQLSFDRTDKASQVVNAFFFAGLFADIGASILSAASARWFEMLTPEESDHVYDWFFNSYPGVHTASPEGSDGEDEEKGNGGAAAKPADNAPPVGAPSLGLGRLSGAPGPKRRLCLMERWMCIGLKSSVYAAFTGLGFLAAGLMVYVWAHTSLPVRVLVTATCVSVFLLLPPFCLPHDRVQTLAYMRLHRFSG